MPFIFHNILCFLAQMSKICGIERKHEFKQMPMHNLFPKYFFPRIFVLRTFNTLWYNGKLFHIKMFFSISLAIFKKLHCWRLNFYEIHFLTLSNNYPYNYHETFWKWPNRKPNSVLQFKFSKDVEGVFYWLALSTLRVWI